MVDAVPSNTYYGEIVLPNHQESKKIRTHTKIHSITTHLADLDFAKITIIATTIFFISLIICACGVSMLLISRDVVVKKLGMGLAISGGTISIVDVLIYWIGKGLKELASYRIDQL